MSCLSGELAPLPNRSLPLKANNPPSRHIREKWAPIGYDSEAGSKEPPYILLSPTFVKMRWLPLVVSVSLLPAQKIISRTQIEVEGYAVEKIGLPQSPVLAGPNRFAFVEYFVQGKLKPKTGYYLECLDTEYNEVWSVLLDIPSAGEGRPIRLIPMARALVALSYEADPLQKGVVQEVGRFYNLKGQPILPKWTAISNYDRPTSAMGFYALSPDSTYLLWYAQEIDKKGQDRVWMAIWSESGRKVVSESGWSAGGRILAAQPDNKARVWALVLASGARVPQLLLYDPKARVTRTWQFEGDTLWVAPALRLTAKGVWIAALAPASENRPTEDGPVGAWRLAYLPQTFSDSTQPLMGKAPLSKDFLSRTKDAVNPQVVGFWTASDSVVYLIWEDRRLKGSIAIATEIGVTCWDYAIDSLSLAWSYLIEKNQRESMPDAVGHLSSLSETFLTIFFLTERTGKGSLRAYLINRETGEALSKDLAQNTAGDLYILPGRAARISARDYMVLALARPGKNGYQIFHIRL